MCVILAVYVLQGCSWKRIKGSVAVMPTEIWVLCVSLVQEIGKSAKLACVHDSARPLVLTKDIQQVKEYFTSYKDIYNMIAISGLLVCLH